MSKISPCLLINAFKTCALFVFLFPRVGKKPQGDHMHYYTDKILSVTQTVFNNKLTAT